MFLLSLQLHKLYNALTTQYSEKTSGYPRFWNRFWN